MIEKNNNLQQNLNKLYSDISLAETETAVLERRKIDLNNDIKAISDNIKITTDELYKKSYELMEEKLNQSAEIMSQKYQNAEKEAKNQYLKLLEENSQAYALDIETKEKEINELKEVIQNLKDKVRVATDERKRQLLSEQEKEYFKLKISNEDIEDISILKEVSKKLHKNTDPINKTIWELYYKRPTLDLLGRITPTGENHCGIYKITNIETGQSYIGQSANLRDRIRDHIKAGLGIASSNNRFYTEMKNIGPENFMYEILEECDRTKLNERERYWIDFYNCIDYGYNTLSGNK